MLIQFSVENFKTFKNKATLSLVASNYDKTDLENSNVSLRAWYRLLNSAIIYWPNASWKTKFFDALSFVQWHVINSANKLQKGDPIDIHAFKLDDVSEKKSSEFEVTFIYNNTSYRYGFEITREKILAEWLFCKPKIREIELFYRDESGLSFHKSKFLKWAFISKERVVRDNVLVLSYATQIMNEVGAVWDAFNWFKNELKFADWLTDSRHRGYTQALLNEDPEKKKMILKMLSDADIGVCDLFIEKIESERLQKMMMKMPESMRQQLQKDINEKIGVVVMGDTFVTREKFDAFWESIGNVNFSMENDESSGTKKFFSLTWLILDALANGTVLVVDELEAKLHPNLVAKIVSLFHSKELNPICAQLIANTHNTNLLDSGLLRRDQVWFVEKDKHGAAEIFSLSDFSVQKSENFELNYTRWKYGAVPFLGDFKMINS